MMVETKSTAFNRGEVLRSFHLPVSNIINRLARK